MEQERLMTARVCFDVKFVSRGNTTPFAPKEKYPDRELGSER